MIKTIIFDLGGVIVSSEIELLDEKIADYLEIPLEEFKEFLAQYKLDLTKGKLSLMDVYSNVLKAFSKTDIGVEDIVKKHLEIFEDSLSDLDENILSLVSRLRKNGYNVVCLTNAESDVVPIVRASGLYNYFERAYISTEIGMAKPSSEIYLTVFEDLDCKPEEVLFIDDKLENVTAARRLGTNIVHYRPHMDLERELAAYSIRTH